MTALLIIDIQNDYFEDGAMPLVGSLDASKNAKIVLEKFRMHNLPVIHIQHIALKPNATFFLPNSNGVNIHNSVYPLPTEKVIVKHFPNSFIETELLEYLKTSKISDLTICGMMTHMCIDATTRAAKDFGFNCTLIGDACATKSLEIDGQTINAASVHYSFLAALNYHYSSVKSTKQILSEFPIQS